MRRLLISVACLTLTAGAAARNVPALPRDYRVRAAPQHGVACIDAGSLSEAVASAGKTFGPSWVLVRWELSNAVKPGEGRRRFLLTFEKAGP